MEQRHFLFFGAGDRPRLTRGDLARALSRGHALRGDLAPEPCPLDGPRPEESHTLAAVLVPLVDRGSGVTVLLTRRTAHLAHHPGQISFPGGRLEKADQGCAVACALRETEEEVGLGRDRFEILGRLDQYVTGTGFSVTPVVGVIAPPFDVFPDPYEVAEVFEVPLDFLLDAANHRRLEREVAGRLRPYWAMTWEERVIWGATAGMLVNLAEVLRQPVAAGDCS